MRPITLLLLLLLPFAGTADADVRIRLSVKVITDAAGNRPTGSLSSDAQISAMIDGANEILDSTGRGYRFVLAESVIPVTGHPEFFAPPDPPDPDGAGPQTAPDPRETHLNALDTASRNDPAGFVRRTDAIHCYFNARSYTAICSFPESATGILLFGQGSFPTSLAHEAGHFFNLIHTHQGDSGAKGQTPPQTLIPGNMDQCDDTEPDHNEWDTDDIAVRLGYSNAAALQIVGTAGDRDRSYRIWRNLMSYHDPAGRSLISEDQMDRLTLTANSSRNAVVTGHSWFVAPDGYNYGGLVNPPWAGLQASLPFRTIEWALGHVASPDDVILLRSGAYTPQSAELTIPCTLAATRGPVTLTRP